MSDVCTGVFAKRRVVPEDVVAFSVFTFACFGWFILQGRDDSRLLMPAGMFFVVMGGWLLLR